MSQLDTALLTVQEAKGKWCPEGRVKALVDEEGWSMVVVNRLDLGGADSASLCLGSACMFWRWHDTGERPQRPLAQAPAEIAVDVDEDRNDLPRWTGMPDDGRDWQIDEEESRWYVPAPPLPPRGYCGKVGHPLQAALLEAQLELLKYQIHDHRFA